MKSLEVQALLIATIDLLSARKIGELKARTILESSLHFGNTNPEAWSLIGPECEILEAMIEDL